MRRIINNCNIMPTLRKWITLPVKCIHLSQPLTAIENDVENQRFVMVLPSDVAYVAYRPNNGTLTLHSIFVPKKYRELGIGQELAREVLEFCADEGIQVVLTCPYLVTFYKQHPYPQFKKVVIGWAVGQKKPIQENG